jgi:ABC-type lipoprotein export system ATPase subunit
MPATVRGKIVIMPNPQNPIVRLENVSRCFKGDSILAVDKLSLTVERGDFLAILGPSGSGKSTLLHLIGGIDYPDSGRVIIDGIEPDSAREWARVRATKIGFVFQSFHLLPTLTAVENVEISMFGTIRSSRQRRLRAEDLLDSVGLGRRGSHRPGELSGGERQRVAIARSLANLPDLLLVDEPTGNLDSKTSEEIFTIFKTIHKQQNTTLVLVTHEPGIARHATRIIRFRDGRIITDEPSTVVNMNNSCSDRNEE